MAGFERSPAKDGVRSRAAVSLCVVPGPGGEACLVITLRASGLRAHPGQHSLPGGRLEPGEDAMGAALREMHEEIGIQCGAADVLGCLDDYVTRPGQRITPVVVWGPSTPAFVLRESEVESVHLLPLVELEDAHAPRLLPIEESKHPVIQMPVDGLWIHAPTAAFLYQFREVVLHGRPTRVAQFEQPPEWWGGHTTL